MTHLEAKLFHCSIVKSDHLTLLFHLLNVKWFPDVYVLRLMISWRLACESSMFGAFSVKFHKINLPYECKMALGMSQQIQTEIHSRQLWPWSLHPPKAEYKPLSCLIHRSPTFPVNKPRHLALFNSKAEFGSQRHQNATSVKCENECWLWGWSHRWFTRGPSSDTSIDLCSLCLWALE